MNKNQLNSVPNCLINLDLLDNNTGQIDGVHANPRDLDNAGFDTIVKSISEFPEMLEARTLVVVRNAKNGRFMVIGGNQRLRALQHLKYKQAPCYIVNWNLDKINRFIIADNLNYGAWNYDKLANEWDSQELIDWGMDLPDFASETKEEVGLTDADEVPEITEEVITQIGDIWKLGEHKIICGDSTDQAIINLLMQDKKADLVLTDPPYLMQTDGGGSLSKCTGFKRKMDAIKSICDFNPDNFLSILPLLFTKSNNKNKSVMNAYVFCSKDLIPKYLNWSINQGYSFNILFWRKGNSVPLGNTHRPDVEYILHFRQNSIWNHGLKDVNYSKCLDYDRVAYKDRLEENGDHPTPKPVEMLKNEILISSHDKSIVVDLFCGSGSTLIACEQSDRICYAAELSQNYVDVTVKRWQDYTGKSAILQQTGKTFDEIKNGK